MDLTKLCEALQSAIDTDAPTTARAAAKLTAALTDQLTELVEWAATVQDLAGDVESAAGELDDADKNDREGAHEGWVQAVSGLRDELVTSLPA